MDINAYIASGVLENYVMGLASEQERQEVQCMSKIYPEIATELHKLETSLEKYALQQAVAPPPQIKKQLWSQLDSASPTIQETTAIRKPLNNQYFPITALAAVSIGVIGLAVFFWFRGHQAGQKLAAAQEQNINLQQQSDSQQTALNQITREINLVRNPAFRSVHLAGTATKAPQATMTVYWNAQSQEVFIAGLNLPTPPNDKQYQLWAIRNGQPVDLGVFDLGTALQNMKNIDQAQAFAVTLEPRGGLPQPTLSEMYVIGNI